VVGIVSVAAALLLAIVASLLPQFTDVPNIWLLILGTAAWAAWDSTRIHIRDYKTTMASHPVVLFSGIVLLWGVFFPWYLAVRYHITHGTQPRKQSIQPVGTSSVPSGAGAAPLSISAELERLAELRARGVITEDEFNAAKARVLGTTA
jgi:hypothetical protein